MRVCLVVIFFLLPVHGCIPWRVIAEEPLSDLQLQQLVQELGASKFELRQQATDKLWQAGESARSFLQEGAASDNRELAFRAKSILKKLDAGIYPETPIDLAEPLINYVTAASNEKHRTLAALVKRHQYKTLLIILSYPNSVYYHNGLAWFLANCAQNLEEAAVHAERAVQLSQGDSSCIDTLAEVYFRQGDVKQAIDLEKKLLSLEPNSTHYRKQLRRFENQE